MRETDQDLVALQALLDRSYAQAGPHLLEIHTPDRRLTATELAERLQGVCVLALATVTRDGRPLVGAVDGIFYRGEFWFGTGAAALRVSHIERSGAVSAVHTVGETLAVTVHGDAEQVDLDRNGGFGEVCRSLYGDTWDSWVGVAPYYRIRPGLMFTFAMEAPR